MLQDLAYELADLIEEFWTLTPTQSWTRIKKLLEYVDRARDQMEKVDVSGEIMSATNKNVEASYGGLSREELLKVLDQIWDDGDSGPSDEIYDILERHGANSEDPEWTSSMTDEDIRDALEELQEIYNAESGLIDWNGSDWYDYDKDYAIVRRNKYGYLVLYHDSQIEEPAALTEKRAIDLINKDRDRRDRKRKDRASERAHWRFIKELDPSNVRDVNEAERNGYYLTADYPVYKYADKHGFVHYTNRVI